jgi:hypothetical protein
MRAAKPIHLAARVILGCTTMLVAMRARGFAQVCTPKILANKLVVTPAQREAAGDIAQPPLTDQADGFAWPDTPMGVLRSDEGYVFFASDGGLHSRQQW